MSDLLDDLLDNLAKLRDGLNSSNSFKNGFIDPDMSNI